MTVLESHLQQLAKELKLKDLPPKEGALYHFPLNPKTTISIEERPEGAYFFAPIHPFPKGRHENLLIYLMKANFLGQGTLGGVIGLDKDENFLTLSFDLPYDMNYRLFREAVEDFANILDYWKEEISRFLKAEG
ncbi:MAG TPA: type III secretion system chaperone [Rhabdochlamydiaceae bacterium]|nr:type III secretion system chaperone [Rhabdochlamydiaceae bacterium]